MPRTPGPFGLALFSSRTGFYYLVALCLAASYVFCRGFVASPVGTTLLAIRDNVAPPTINYATPDPACDLDYVPNTARQMKVDVAMSNSFGFGGTNGTLVFRRFKG